MNSCIHTPCHANNCRYIPYPEKRNEASTAQMRKSTIGSCMCGCASFSRNISLPGNRLWRRVLNSILYYTITIVSEAGQKKALALHRNASFWSEKWWRAICWLSIRTSVLGVIAQSSQELSATNRRQNDVYLSVSGSDGGTVSQSSSLSLAGSL